MKGYWRVRLVDGDFIGNKECTWLRYDGEWVRVGRSELRKTEVVTGWFWWRKVGLEEQYHKVTLFLFPTPLIKQCVWTEYEDEKEVV